MNKLKSALGDHQKSFADIAKFLDDISLMLSPGGLELLTTGGFFQSSTQALDAASRMADAALPVPDALIAARIAEYHRQEILARGVAFVSLTVAIYLFVAFFYSIHSGIAFLRKALALVAKVQRNAEILAEIEASAKKFGDIMSLIDNIAFQTNIIALNAAV